MRCAFHREVKVTEPQREVVTCTASTFGSASSNVYVSSGLAATFAAHEFTRMTVPWLGYTSFIAAVWERVESGYLFVRSVCGCIKELATERLNLCVG